MPAAVPTTAAAGKKTVLHLSSSTICRHAIWEASCIMSTQASTILSMWAGICHGVGQSGRSCFLLYLLLCPLCTAAGTQPLLHLSSSTARHAVWEASCMYHAHARKGDPEHVDGYISNPPIRQGRTDAPAAMSAAALHWAHKPACNAINQLYSTTGHLVETGYLVRKPG